MPLRLRILWLTPRRGYFLGGRMTEDALLQFPALEDHYRAAAAQGFPAFLGPIAESTPVNATPYVLGLEALRREVFDPPRHSLLQALLAALDELPAYGVAAEVLLIGGSFLRGAAAPRDLDCVVYFRRDRAEARPLEPWRQGLRAAGLDLRLVPIEMDATLVLKTAVYFSVLYTVGRAETAPKGVLLVDCSR